MWRWADGEPAERSAEICLGVLRFGAVVVGAVVVEVVIVKDSPLARQTPPIARRPPPASPAPANEERCAHVVPPQTRIHHGLAACSSVGRIQFAGREHNRHNHGQQYV